MFCNHYCVYQLVIHSRSQNDIDESLCVYNIGFSRCTTGRKIRYVRCRYFEQCALHCIRFVLYGAQTNCNITNCNYFPIHVFSSMCVRLAIDDNADGAIVFRTGLETLKLCSSTEFSDDTCLCGFVCLCVQIPAIRRCTIEVQRVHKGH